jgi:hypothetical protein
MRKKRNRKSFALLLIGLLIWLMMPTALAVERIDPSQTGSLTMESQYQKEPVSGMAWTLYRVAFVSSEGKFTLLSDFADSGLTLNGYTEASQWNQAAKKAADWAANQKLTHLAQQTTDDKGKATFEDLNTGMYLVVSSSVKVGSHTYTAAPCLLSVPNLTADGKGWLYQVTAAPKLSASSSGGGGGGKPSKPTNPNQPDNPSKPDNPDNPNNPDQPDNPDHPNDPDQPDQPDNPSDPDHPNQPDNPTNPDAPNNLDSPSQSDKPNTPGNPSHSQNGNGGTPTLPQTGQVKWPVPTLAADLVYMHLRRQSPNGCPLCGRIKQAASESLQPVYM